MLLDMLVATQGCADRQDRCAKHLDTLVHIDITGLYFRLLLRYGADRIALVTPYLAPHIVRVRGHHERERTSPRDASRRVTL